MSYISVKPLEIEPKYMLPLKEFRQAVLDEYTNLIDEDPNSPIGRSKLEKAIDIESDYYMAMQKKISYNELIKEIWKDPKKGEFLEYIAKRISDEAFDYYLYVKSPITISVLNRKLGKQWRVRFPQMSFTKMVIILCENSYIKFELFGTKTGTKLLVPSLLRRLEGTPDHITFKFNTCVEDNNFPKLTPELQLGYL